MKVIGPQQVWQNYLEEGKFMIQRSKDSGAYVFYPRVLEPGTGSANLEWVKASGGGTVHSTTIARKKPPTPDYNVSIIELDEGPRMLSRVEGIDPEAVKIGMRVKARITQVDDAALLVFDLEEGAGS